MFMKMKLLTSTNTGKSLPLPAPTFAPSAGTATTRKETRYLMSRVQS
jgi:hypothetical protein